MAGTSSADPRDLDGWVEGSASLDRVLRGRHSTVNQLHNEVTAKLGWGHFDASSMLSGFGRYLDENDKDGRWTATIAGLFRQADSRPGIVTDLPDSVIAAGLQAAGLAGNRKSVTFDDAIAWGMPPTTGYANDPVNTASGNFVEVEADLDLGGLLSALSFRRTYNSRSDLVGPFGPGWASWASARLRAAPDGAHWEGPDGQRALLPPAPDGAGYRRVVGLSGLVVPHGSGLALEWFGGRRWEFDAEGLPLAVDHGPGTRVRFEHAGGRLVGLVHDSGVRLDVRWSGERVVAVECSDGRRVDYRYDDAARLVEAVGPGGARRYELDAQGRVLTVTDADGVVEVRNTYDADGRVLEQVSPHGRRTRMRYLPGGVTVVDDLDGGPTNTYLHDQQGRLVRVIDGHGAELVKEYDVWGNPTTVTDRLGAVTLQQWDDRARMTRRVLPGGAAVEFEYDGSDRAVRVSAGTGGEVTLRYSGAERIPSEIVDPEGGITRLEVEGGLVRRVTDPDGVELGFGHDAHGRVVSITDPYDATTAVERDAAGRVVAVISATGRRTEQSYDEAGRPTRWVDPSGAEWRRSNTPAGRPASVTDPTGATTGFGYGDNGELERVVDPLGHAVGHRFDVLGNLVGRVAEDGAKWEFRYDALCRLVGVHDPAGGSWVREHDAGGNVVAELDPAGVRRTAARDRRGLVTRIEDGLTWAGFEHDGWGRLTALTRPDGIGWRVGYDRSGRPVSVTDPLGGVTRYGWTPGGRLASVTDPLGGARTVEYDRAGRRAAEVDAGGRRRSYRYDADGRVTRVTAAGESWAYGYDAVGRLATHRHPDGGETRFRYDPAGRLIEVVDPTGGTVRYAYDAAGRLVETVDAVGGVSSYTYDLRGRPTRVTDPLGQAVTRGYDEVGRLTSATDALGLATRWEHDRAGRVTRLLDPAGGQLRWSYDTSGRMAGYQCDESAPVTVDRDALGRIVEVTEPGRRHRLAWDGLDRLVAKRSGGAELRWEYDAAGRRVVVIGPDGSRTGYGYDASGLLETAEHPLLGTVRLTRDAAGRVTGLEAAGRRIGWSYRDGRLAGHRTDRDGRVVVTDLERNAAGRVVTETRDGTARRYGYDAAGQLTSADDRRYGYDAAGRLTNESGPDGEVRYAYDAAGRLRECRVGGEVTEYRYDPAGRRVSETGPGGERRFSWDPLGRLTGILQNGAATTLSVDAFGDLAAVGEIPLSWDPTGPVSRLCSIGDTQVLGCDGQQWAVAGPDGTRWLDPDWQGSVGGEHDPWGQPLGGPPAGGLGPGWRGELVVDGLSWLRHRAYDPATRTFLSPDPWPPVAGTPVSGNPYHYANNDPVNLVDPLGLRPMTDADLAAYRDSHQGFISDAGDWVGDHWEEIAAAAVVAGGVGLLFVPGGQGIGIGILVGAGGNLVGQYAAKGEVDWGEVAFKGLAGGAGGVVGSRVLAMAGTMPIATQGGAGVLAPYALGGAASAFTSSSLSEVRDVSNGQQVDLGGLAFKTVSGAAFGAGGGTFAVSGGAGADALRQATSSTGSVWAETVKQMNDAGTAPPPPIWAPR